MNCDSWCAMRAAVGTPLCAVSLQGQLHLEARAWHLAPRLQAAARLAPVALIPPKNPGLDAGSNTLYDALPSHPAQTRRRAARRDPSLRRDASASAAAASCYGWTHLRSPFLNRVSSSLNHRDDGGQTPRETECAMLEAVPRAAKVERQAQTAPTATV